MDTHGWITQKSGRKSIATEYRKNNSKLFSKLFYWKETGILVTVCTDCIRNLGAQGKGTLQENNESEIPSSARRREVVPWEEDETGERVI